jgi:TonB family protein
MEVAVRLAFIISILGASLSLGCAHEALKSALAPTKEAFKAVIQNHAPEIRKCYDDRDHTKGDLFGRLVIEWDIGNRGKVTKAEVKESLDPAVDSCILKRSKTWKFPEPPAGKTFRVSYPFDFVTELST